MEQNETSPSLKPTTLLVLLGPTGVGKTETSIRLAEHFKCPIVSSDSRQLYRELKIGTAAPTPEQLRRVPHFFVGTHSIFDHYSAGQYELDVIKLLNELFLSHKVVVLAGGSMMYIDAVCNGIDDIPTVDQETRHRWKQIFEEKGSGFVLDELKKLDPVYYEQVDRCNFKRVVHALEICDITGRPFSDIRTGQKKERPFNIVKIGFTRNREELYERINARVDEMMAEGLLEEAAPFYSHRHLNTLNTVGYKEIYEYMDGKRSLESAVELIKQDSRRYAKKQLSWFNRDQDIRWFHPDQLDEILKFCGANSEVASGTVSEY